MNDEATVSSVVTHDHKTHVFIVYKPKYSKKYFAVCPSVWDLLSFQMCPVGADALCL